jgi:hypothetical protein
VSLTDESELGSFNLRVMWLIILGKWLDAASGWVVHSEDSNFSDSRRSIKGGNLELLVGSGGPVGGSWVSELTKTGTPAGGRVRISFSRSSMAIC